ncbi:MAG TPA: glycosyltransferase family A protein [Vicinamibacterales bacterium]|nr:glycosyltransferase family A protein [Vicinamibacterales bacterium]
MSVSTVAPRVSVLMTAFNRESLIAESIESVLAQTMTDFELVIVDDCSTDGTVRVVQRYLSDPRVRLVQNERNLGDYPNRNHAATLAGGEFLKYHDSDDVMYPHCLEIMVQALERYPAADFAMSCERSWPGGPVPMLLTPRMCYQREFLGTTGLFNQGPSSAMFRTRRFHELGRFPQSGPYSDGLFWLRACTTCSVVLTQANLIYYRIHQGQEMNAAGPRAHAEFDGVLFRALDAPECPLSLEEREQAKRNMAWGVLKNALFDFRDGQSSLALYRLRRSTLSAAEWLKYARRQRRVPSAGTPANEASARVIREHA